VGKDAATNTVVVGERERLGARGCIAGEANWLVDEPARGEWVPVLAKYRYNTPAATAEVRVLDEGGVDSASGRVGRFEVRFGEPQTAVAPGQAVVLYDAAEPDVVMGGGWIEGVARIA